MTSPTLIRLFLLTLCALAINVQAAGHSSGLVTGHRRHGSLARNVRNTRSLKRRCKPRSGKNTQKAQTTDGTGDSAKVDTAAQQNNQEGGTIQASSGSCGDPGATKKTTATTGPNGSIDWLNCGIDQGGWNPPYIKVKDLKSVSLSDALKDPNSPFQACSKFTDKFEKYASDLGFPAIILASFAMQESSCNPETVGGAGEQGLMQITKDKCGNAPGGNCKDPDYNIKTGAQFFKDTLDNNNGDFLKTVGRYNGWSDGLTFGKATAAGNGGNCREQNNLDYLFQFVNGWMQNVNVYGSQRFGKYFNLDKCN